MKWLSRLLLVVVIAGSAVLIEYVILTSRAGTSQSQKAGEEKAEHEETAKVKLAAAREGQIEETIVAYGVAASAPEDVRAVSVPFESLVERVWVVAGQAVEAGGKLADVAPSPDAQLQLSDARSALQAADRDLELVRQRLELKLATKADLTTAEQSQRVAEAKLKSLEARQIERRQLTASQPSVVAKVIAQEGQLVPAGGSLVELSPADKLQARLGVEPSQAAKVKPGQTVHLRPVEADFLQVEGTVRTVANRVNPASRLIDVYVTLPEKSALRPESYLRGRIVVGTHTALLVPRPAVLPEEDKRILYTVKDDKAVRHEVKTGLEDENDIEITESDLKSGDQVVIEGNYELEDGMNVEAEAEDEDES